MDTLFIRNGLIVFIILWGSLIFHEIGHAYAAHLLGDDTPEREGRLTLNPMAHMNWMGTVFVPALNIFVFGATLPFIGWGEPVIPNLSNFKHRNLYDLLVAVAGPATNLLLALAVVVLGSFIVPSQPRMGGLVLEIAYVNVGIAVFNLIPIPPLDGGIVMRHIAGFSEEAYLSVSRWSWIALLIVLNMDAFQQALSVVVSLCCIPYKEISQLISPLAARLIFRS
ncbi:MAG TPA: site-2 protease family protein [Opitutaceae bacterium]|jgi:Zn-dependent protease|nr:site-2 protease family protein [Opitutaceae bacterium]